MKKWLTLFAFCVGVTVLTALLSACSGKPAISVTDSLLALGDVVNGDVITREVSVQNNGQADLIIDTVTTSCGCTQATIEPLTIPAGSSGTLSISFDSGAHGPALTGPLVRQVFITSNDPQQPEITVELTANILPPAGS
ncbi:MAG: DUF1573 domain-containing protein [Candidatus Promineifilaceae bacterium]